MPFPSFILQPSLSLLFVSPHGKKSLSSVLLFACQFFLALLISTILLLAAAEVSENNALEVDLWMLRERLMAQESA